MEMSSKWRTLSAAVGFLLGLLGGLNMAQGRAEADWQNRFIATNERLRTTRQGGGGRLITLGAFDHCEPWEKSKGSGLFDRSGVWIGLVVFLIAEPIHAQTASR